MYKKTPSTSKFSNLYALSWTIPLLPKKYMLLRPTIVTKQWLNLVVKMTNDRIQVTVSQLSLILGMLRSLDFIIILAFLFDSSSICTMSYQCPYTLSFQDSEVPTNHQSSFYQIINPALTGLSFSCTYILVYSFVCSLASSRSKLLIIH